MKNKITKIDDNFQNEVINILTKEWGSSLIISKGKKYYINRLPGFILLVDNKIQGIITYFIKNKKCEIITLNCFIENKGIGTKLINKLKEVAKEKNCKRILLVTTNDNIKAIMFYQKKGFEIKKINFNIIKKSRKLKPEIPEKGFYDIPILHEIEFELKL